MLEIRNNNYVFDCDVPTDGVTIIVGNSVMLLNYFMTGIANSVIGYKDIISPVEHFKKIEKVKLNPTNIIETEDIIKNSDILEKDVLFDLLYKPGPCFNKDKEIYANVYENFGGGYHPEIQISMAEKLKGKAVLSLNSPFALQAFNLRKIELSIVFCVCSVEQGRLRMVNYGGDCRELFRNLSDSFKRIVWGKHYSL